MKPEWAEIIEHAKNSPPIVGMMKESTDGDEGNWWMVER